MIAQLPTASQPTATEPTEGCAGKKSPGKKRRRARGQRRINKRFSDGFSVGRRGCVSVGPRYRDLRGPIAGEAVVTLATPEYPFRLPVASPTRTR